MIKKINIENYRSIISDSVTFEPLTVFIGANGSGKSSLVKALQFISQVPEIGVERAIAFQGGRETVIPKSIPASKLANHPLKIHYEIKLSNPVDGEVGPESIDVIHSFEIKMKEKGQVQVTKENLEFFDHLFVGEVFGRDKNDKEAGYQYNNTKSRFYINRKKTGKVEHSFYPKLMKDQVDIFLSWLGFSQFSENITSISSLRDFLGNYSKSKRKYSNTKENGNVPLNKLLIEESVKKFCEFSPQYQVFISTVKRIKRYDLLLNELRTEQSASTSPSLDFSGGNMPSALRSIATTKQDFDRLKTSFESIAPHITSFESKPLRNGKEFIEFLETENGRGVESWEESDGSLRALAILIALESAQYGDTIIIEEPEQNLHPWAIRVLIDHIREVIEERNLQVILTTHSEHVLDKISPEELRVATRTKNDGSKFKTLRQIVGDRDIHMGDIGRMWVKGLLGGIPEYDL